MNNAAAYMIELFQSRSGESFLLFWAKEILVALLIFGLFWIFSQAVIYLLQILRGRLSIYLSKDILEPLADKVIHGLSRLLTLLGIYLAIRSLPLHERIALLVSGAVFLVLVFILLKLLYDLCSEVIRRYVAAEEENSAYTISRQMLPVVQKLISLFLIGFGLMVVLKHFNYDIFSVVTALGIGSLAIGMAAKDTLAHMISGFTIMLDRPFRIGDRIQLTGGQIGDVTEIGLRSTRIRTLDNQMLIIPNSELCNTMVCNQASPDRRVKVRINVGVSYDSDIEKVKALLVSSASETESVLSDPPPEGFFVSLGDSSLNMALFFWVEDYVDSFSVTDKINSRIIKLFRENQIEIPFPT